jgi:hypothetical protein
MLSLELSKCGCNLQKSLNAHHLKNFTSIRCVLFFDN